MSDTTVNFWNKIALKYSKSPIKNEDAYLKKIEQTKDLLSEESRMLEFGCGTGTTALKLAPYAGSILATDFSESMIEIAKEKIKTQENNNLEFKCISIEAIHLEPESFDVVSAQSVLHLVESKENVMKKVYESLSPDGYFVSSTACIGDFMPFFKWIAPLGKRLGLLPMLRVFGRKELEKSIENSGFKILDVWQPSRAQSVFIVAQKI